jgi:hypothetical protein
MPTAPTRPPPPSGCSIQLSLLPPAGSCLAAGTSPRTPSVLGRSAASCFRTPWSTNPSPDARTSKLWGSGPQKAGPANRTDHDRRDRRHPRPPGQQLQRRPAPTDGDRPGTAVRPQVLFLDEPALGLDTRIRHDLFDIIARLRDLTGVTILMTTHYLDEAERLCDRLAVIDAGTVVACDSPASLLASMGARSLSSAWTRPTVRRRSFTRMESCRKTSL